jgi:hypothetical protein
MIRPETEYLMTRAKDEAVLAIKAGHPAAAEAHQEMAVRYANRAVTELAEGEAVKVVAD